MPIKAEMRDPAVSGVLLLTYARRYTVVPQRMKMSISVGGGRGSRRSDAIILDGEMYGVCVAALFVNWFVHLLAVVLWCRNSSSLFVHEADDG